MEDLRRIEEALRAWEEEVLSRTLQRAPERKEKFVLESGIELSRLYTPLDLRDWDYLQKAGFPGSYPFTRGVYATMYRGRIWTFRQYAGYGTAVETNRRYKYLLSQGQTGLSVAFDLPTQVGLDSDHPLAYGEVGKVGVAIDSVEDMRILFQDIPLDRVSTSMTINSTAANLLAMYVLVAEEQGASRASLRGTVQNDILKEYIARGTYIFPPEPSMKLVVDIMEFCSKEMPKWNSISVSGYHMREAGANAVQEVAFTLADGMEYVRRAVERGLDVDSFAPRISFFFASHNNFFEEIAKFRAARRMWARIMRERFGAKKPRSWMLRFHTQTAGSTLQALEPLNNVIRVTIQALAAVLGGTQSLHTNSYDEALSLPTEESVKLALRTQQIIAYESGVADVVDPLGGSYFVEWLTDRIEEEAWRYIDAIESMGGMTRAVEMGYVQREIARSAYEYQKKVESGEIPILGVNMFRSEEEPKIELLKVSPEVEEEQRRRLRELKERRDGSRVEARLAELRRAAERGENLVPYILEAHRALATLGEVTDVLREVYGEYEPPVIY
ncbi:MAG: methylmalonyl-CoA mutase [Thermoplasmata archaeon]|nr:MAG: methylmalonyl-CoA mutase [Thermoplasmata archaeon]HDJ27325.1 methylmalonyl-CoA mutase [Aciduliprofundum sp.]